MTEQNAQPKPAAKKTAAAKPKYKVGDTWTLPKGETMVILPDGCAVTARSTFTFPAPGEYRCGKSKVTVAPAAKAK